MEHSESFPSNNFREETNLTELNKSISNSFPLSRIIPEENIKSPPPMTTEINAFCNSSILNIQRDTNIQSQAEELMDIRSPIRERLLPGMVFQKSKINICHYQVASPGLLLGDSTMTIGLVY